MALTPAQLVTLRADIDADPVFSVLPNNDDTSFAIAEAYNQTASPDWIVWRTNLSREELFDATVLTELISRSQGERDTYRTMLDQGVVSAAKASIRQAFADIFSGPAGATTRAQLTAVAKRTATRAEKLFSTGTGSDAAPATMSFEGSLSYHDVAQARAN